MNILLYNPDNEVTHNFMPHLWMFLLKSLTPPEHRVLLVDGNAQRMSERALVRYVRDNQIDLVGIGAMTRMAAKAYRMADAVRAAGVPVVMGGRTSPRFPTKRWATTRNLAMLTQWPSEKRTKPGRALLPTPSAAR
jgi:hypothetical protein